MPKPLHIYINIHIHTHVYTYIYVCIYVSLSVNIVYVHYIIAKSIIGEALKKTTTITGREPRVGASTGDEFI